MELRPSATFFLTLAVVAILSLLSVLPHPAAFTHTNIYSQLSSDSALCVTAGYETWLDTAIYDEPVIDNDVRVEVTQPEKWENSGAISQASINSDTISRLKSSKTSTDSTTIGRSDGGRGEKSMPNNQSVTSIEDFTDGGVGLSNFYEALQGVGSMARPVRIAVLGDSFIEGDIFTQDLREFFQNRFGGRGVGYVPITSTVAGFRQSVGHSFDGWATHSIVNKLGRGGYVMSSFTYTPKSQTAHATYKGSKSRRNLDHFSRARFMFINKGQAKIDVLVNGTSKQSFTPVTSDRLSQVVVIEDSIGSISFTVTGDDSFTAYGAYLEDSRGVNVDNYSVRGNSGVSLSSIDVSLTRQMGEMLPVDLVIFEYGLNVAQADVKNYSLYLSQMQKAITHIRECLPNAAILVMSIPDRVHRSSNGWVTMPGVEAMARTQRQLAQTTGVLYWSMIDAMRARGGMSKFVERGWAAKDYTHLSPRGGREIGRALFDALMFDMQNR